MKYLSNHPFGMLKLYTDRYSYQLTLIDGNYLFNVIYRRSEIDEFQKDVIKLSQIAISQNSMLILSGIYTDREGNGYIPLDITDAAVSGPAIIPSASN
ncbi:hypothetical protein FGI60_02280 [Brucella haematophila]|uniref:hypothetical protein n=1 Tax=Brucella haematophila TaxID=419474 RepID=UPI001486ED78|nr:hypothetical protein [Brucella haematophila]TMV06157.1 hypothetical protein FGI60_02280 [Brucella haematophila]